jgi:hypothetical protein
MWNFLTGIWYGVQRIFYFVFPVLVKAHEARGVWIGLLWILHIALVLAVLVGLYFLGTYTSAGNPINWNPTLKRFYWPLMALLVYGLIWLSWYLWLLLTPEQEETAYPDIDAAWGEAVTALEQAGIGLASAPLFLVLGKPSGTEEALFEASRLRLSVRRVPPRAAAPLHLYAGSDGIFVTCAGASLLGQLSDILGGIKEPVFEDAESDGTQSIRLGGGTMLPDANMKKIQKILRASKEGKLTDEEKRELEKLYRRDEAKQGHMLDRAKQALLKDPQKVAEAAGRLRRLCKLIVRDRHPFCSANGILVLLPISGASSDTDAGLMGEICQRDMAEARRGLKVNCPVFTLACDVETIPGFREFRGGFSEEELLRRIGQKYELAPDLRDEDQVLETVESSVRWIGDSTVPGFAYKFFQIETAGRETSADAFRKNALLYQFMGTMRERVQRLGRVVSHGLLKQQDERPLYGGCYIAGSGRAENDQAFVAGFFRLLFREQDHVAWTQEALNEEASVRRMIGMGYIALAALAVIDVALLAIAILKSGS